MSKISKSYTYCREALAAQVAATMPPRVSAEDAAALSTVPSRAPSRQERAAQMSEIIADLRAAGLSARKAREVAGRQVREIVDELATIRKEARELAPRKRPEKVNNSGGLRPKQKAALRAASIVAEAKQGRKSGYTPKGQQTEGNTLVLLEKGSIRSLRESLNADEKWQKSQILHKIWLDNKVENM